MRCPQTHGTVKILMYMATKTCPKCAAQFTCDGDNDCWCEQVQIHKKEMVEIMENYTDCLCPSCLNAYERE